MLRPRGEQAEGPRAGFFRFLPQVAHFRSRRNGRAIEPSHNMVARFYSEMRSAGPESTTGGICAKGASRSTLEAKLLSLAVRGATKPLPTFKSSRSEEHTSELQS